jgi:hypothetical protein
MEEKIRQSARELLTLLETKSKLDVNEYCLAQALVLFKERTKHADTNRAS